MQGGGVQVEAGVQDARGSTAWQSAAAQSIKFSDPNDQAVSDLLDQYLQRSSGHLRCSSAHSASA